MSNGPAINFLVYDPSKERNEKYPLIKRYIKKGMQKLVIRRTNLIINFQELISVGDYDIFVILCDNNICRHMPEIIGIAEQNNRILHTSRMLCAKDCAHLPTIDKKIILDFFLRRYTL